MRAGYPVRELVKAVTMYGNACFSIKQGEQLHGSAAVMKKAHPEYTAEVLECRSFLHAALPLVRVRPDEEDRRARKLRAELEGTLEKTPKALTAAETTVSVADAEKDA